MALSIPRVTLRVSIGDESAFGEFGGISLGYGLHQAWVYATMFATGTLFSDDLTYVGPFGESICISAFLSMIVFGVVLIAAALIDQKLVPFMQKRSTVIIATACMCIGTLIMLVPDGTPDSVTWLDVLPGILTGIGSAIMILAWGCRFARRDVLGIALNTAFSICLGFFIYAAVLAILPFPFGGIVTACIPLIELAFLLSDRSAFGIISTDDGKTRTLPVHKGAFLWRFGAPVFVFGLALNVLRRNTVQTALAATNSHTQMIIIAATGLAFVIFLLIIIANARNSSIRRYFRVLVPIIALAILMIPSIGADNASLQTMFVLAAYMCFESLMWAYFAETSQRYRISPILAFGAGRGLLAVASVLGAYLTTMATDLIDSLPFGDESVLIVMLVVMVCAYAVLPSDHEVAQMVDVEETVDAKGVQESALIDPLDEARARASKARSQAKGTSATSDFLADGAALTTSVAPSATGGDATRNYPDDAASAYAAATTSISEGLAAQAGASATMQAQGTPSQARITMQNSGSPAASPLTKEEEAVARERANKGWFRARCEKVSNTYLLSDRESEVMFYLAKGYNAAYIQEKLYISEGTAKTHMRHIYRKLDIHSQQELMRMVETAEVERPVYQ